MTPGSEPPKTQNQVSSVRYKWTIEQFSSLSTQPGEPVYSPTFSAKGDFLSKWQLILFPQGTAKHNTDNPAIRLRLVSGKQTTVKQVVSILNRSGQNSHTQKKVANHAVKIHSPSADCQDLISKEILMQSSKELLPDDKLTLVCCIIDPDRKNRTSFTEAWSSQQTFMPNFGYLLKTPLFSDVTLVAEGGEFPVHRALLAGRSPVFESIFYHSNEKRIPIPDVRTEVLQAMLHYIYKGFIHSDNCGKMTEELFLAARKYGIVCLEEHCLSYMKMTLTVENAVARLLLAETESVPTLKTTSLKFLVNHATQVGKSASWQKILAYPELLSEALRALVSASKN